MIRTRAARPSDVAGIHRLIRTYARQGVLLPRTEQEIRARINRFAVLEDAGRIVACAALEPYSAAEAELRSLAVDPGWRGRGLGKQMIQAVLQTARQKGFLRVFAVSRSADFFVRQGFDPLSRLELPQKLARDCCRCPREANCQLGAAVFFFPAQQASGLLPSGVSVSRL